MSAKWITKNSSGSANKMTKIVIAQKLGVYAKELGMGVEPSSAS
jgi:hypothetical protein